MPYHMLNPIHDTPPPALLHASPRDSGAPRRSIVAAAAVIAGSLALVCSALLPVQAPAGALYSTSAAVAPVRGHSAALKRPVPGHVRVPEGRGPPARPMPAAALPVTADALPFPAAGAPLSGAVVRAFALVAGAAAAVLSVIRYRRVQEAGLKSLGLSLVAATASDGAPAPANASAVQSSDSAQADEGSAVVPTAVATFAMG